MIPFVSVIGRGNTGKTTLIRKLIRELGQLSYRVAVIKHDPDDHGEVDREGSDTWVFRKEGSHAVILASPSKVTLFRTTENEQLPEELFPLCGNVDLIILEGYKKRDYPKIFLWTGKREELNIDPNWNVIAVIYAQEEEQEVMKRFKETAIPLFCRDDSMGIARFVERFILQER